MSMARAVTMIQPQTIRLQNGTLPTPARKRVAAYARVSTDTEEQLSSYEAQVDHYSRYIQNNPSWDYVGVYTDEGISATSTKNREGFKRMVSDALSGKINLILTKSISRFARNTVDTLMTVRELKAHGVEVFFEKENIYTMDAKGELLITIMSSLAQEESRSISENTTWGRRKRFADGKVSLPYKHFLGYEKGEDDLPRIVEQEAKVVRLIFQLFLEGKTISAIAKRLEKDGVPSPMGKTNWSKTTIEHILSNEKYKGDALLQKTFTVDFLTKKSKVNEGEVPQYYVKNSHPAIVSPEVFDLAQAEIKRRRALKYVSAASCFSSKIICFECGGFFGSKVWHSNSKYRRTIWQCNHKFSNGDRCKTPHLYDAEIQNIFISAFNQHLQNRDEIFASYSEIVEHVADIRPLEIEHEQVDREINELEARIEQLIKKNTSVVLDQEEYRRRHDGYLGKYQLLKARQVEIDARIGQQKAKRGRIETYLNTLANQNAVLTEFDEGLFMATVDSITVTADGKAVVRFQDESTIDCDQKLRRRG